jgi:hypothetical protein
LQAVAVREMATDPEWQMPNAQKGGEDPTIQNVGWRVEKSEH